MSVSKRLQYHLRKNVINSIVTGGKAAHAMTEGTHEAVQLGATLAGFQVGMAVGGLRMLSPANLVESLVVSEAQMDKTINEEVDME